MAGSVHPLQGFPQGKGVVREWGNVSLLAYDSLGWKSLGCKSPHLVVFGTFLRPLYHIAYTDPGSCIF